MQKHERGDRKEESNDSPEIPDRGKTDIPGLLSGFKKEEWLKILLLFKKKKCLKILLLLL